MSRPVLAVAAVLALAAHPNPVRAGFTLSGFSAGPNGGAQVDGFPADNQAGYNSMPGVVTNTVSGYSGDADNNAFYAASMTYDVPASGSLLSVSGNWSFGTHLTSLTAGVGGGLLFDSYLTITAGQTFTISGTMENAGITFLDPDNQSVFPYVNNYFSGTSDPVSITGTLTKTGTYRLNMTSSIFTGGSPGYDADYHGGYDLTFTVSDAPIATPAPPGLVLAVTGAAGLIPLWWRRRKATAA